MPRAEVCIEIVGSLSHWPSSRIDWISEQARIFQHEYDHLDGTVYIDRLDEEGRARVQPRLNELIEEFGEGGAL